MKKIFLFSMFACMMALTAHAQDDDMYFTPKKSAKTKTTSTANTQKVIEVYYVGSSRDVDEYNRRGQYWSHYQKIGTDETGNDIIEFQQGAGVYPDSTYVDTTFVVKYADAIDNAEYAYTQRMARFDDFWPGYYYTSRWYGYPYWTGWYDPWYSSYYYGSYYYPWYTGGWYGYPYGYYGWGYPYSYYAWGYPWGYYGWAYAGYRPRPTYPPSHGSVAVGGRGGTTHHPGNFGRTANTRHQVGSQQRNGTFNRQTPNTNRQYPSVNTQRSTSGMGSFGGARSGGGSFGGGMRSGGGGHFGTRR